MRRAIAFVNPALLLLKETVFRAGILKTWSLLIVTLEPDTTSFCILSTIPYTLYTGSCGTRLLARKFIDRKSSYVIEKKPRASGNGVVVCPEIKTPIVGVVRIVYARTEDCDEHSTHTLGPRSEVSDDDDDSTSASIGVSNEASRDHDMLMS